MSSQVQSLSIDLKTSQIALIFFSLLLHKIIASNVPSNNLYFSACLSHYNETLTNQTLIVNQYKVNVQSLLTKLASASSASRFYTTTAGNPPSKSYGLYLCRGDVSQKLCSSCVTNLTEWVATGQSNCTEIGASTDYCMLRYANYYFFDKANSTGLGEVGGSSANSKPSRAYNQTLEGVVEKVITLAAYNSSNLFSIYKEGVIGEHQKVYAMAQCVPDISRGGCSECLKAGWTNLERYMGNAKVGWATRASCQLRYDNASFAVSPAVATCGSVPAVVSVVSIATWTLLLISLLAFS